MESMNPLISIIIPLYNKEHTIQNTISSVLKQEYQNFEIVVIDDGSTDKSGERVKEINDNRIRIIRKSNGGVSSARNAGILASKGDWILFLDADDTLLCNALNELVSNIVDTKTIVAGNFLVRDSNQENKYLLIKDVHVYDEEYKIFRAWALRKIFLRTGSFIIPTETAKKELYNEQFSRFEDLDFLFRCFKHVKVKILPDIVMVYEVAFAEASMVNQERSDKDYLLYLPFKKNQFWKNCVCGEYANYASKLYPKINRNIKKKYEPYRKFQVISRVLYWYSILSVGFFERCKRKFK